MSSNRRLPAAALCALIVLAASTPLFAQGSDADGGIPWAVVRHALWQYVYGIGWLIIAVVFCIGTYKVFDWVDPLDFRKELEKNNIAMGIVIGMLLLGLTLGTLIFAGMIS